MAQPGAPDGLYIPLQAVAGFLIVVRLPVVLPEQLQLVREDQLPGVVVLMVTALPNPFYGILADEGVAVLLTIAT